MLVLAARPQRRCWTGPLRLIALEWGVAEVLEAMMPDLSMNAGIGVISSLRIVRILRITRLTLGCPKSVKNGLE